MSSTARAIYADRVAAYATSRPDYPQAAVALLADCYEVTSGAAVADVGAGTGLLSLRLLRAGYEVTAIEPDPVMRSEAERGLPGGSCAIRDGCAEATGLADGTIDAIAVGQALHWFDAAAAAEEFRRISRGRGILFCIWNERRRSGSTLLSELDRLLLDCIPAYRDTLHDRLDPARLTIPYSIDGQVNLHRFAARQFLSADGLVARVLSASYAPHPNSAAGQDLTARVADLAARHPGNGTVCLELEVIVTVCRLR